MNKLLVFITSLIVLVNCLNAQNTTCANAQPFCTGTPVSYPAGQNAGSAQPGPSYGCLGSQPNPAWFSLQIATPGPLQIVMQANQDIDFSDLNYNILVNEISRYFDQFIIKLTSS